MEITQELVKELFEYKDGGLYWKENRTSNARKGDKAGAKNSLGYRHIRINKKIYPEHRLIFLFHCGYLPNLVDHINGNTLDNRIENLREASNSQNTYNSKKYSTNSSGHKGVCWDKTHNKWIVRLNIDKKNKFFGSFRDFELACLAADEARDLYHGEYARHG